MKKLAVVTHEGLKGEMTMIETIFGNGKTPSFRGEVLAIDPPAEEFATYNENFEHAVETGEAVGVIDGVVYFDDGADRAYLVGHDHVELSEVQ